MLYNHLSAPCKHHPPFFLSSSPFLSSFLFMSAELFYEPIFRFQKRERTLLTLGLFSSHLTFWQDVRNWMFVLCRAGHFFQSSISLFCCCSVHRSLKLNFKWRGVRFSVWRLLDPKPSPCQKQHTPRLLQMNYTGLTSVLFIVCLSIFKWTRVWDHLNFLLLNYSKPLYDSLRSAGASL